MTTRRSRRSTAPVDYSVFTEDDGEDSGAKRAAAAADDESDGFEPKEEDAPSDDHMDLDADEPDEDNDEEAMDLDDDEFDGAKPSKRGKATPKKKAAAPPKPKTSTPRAKKASTTPAKSANTNVPWSRKFGSLVERMMLILGANKANLIEAVNARDVWGNTMFLPQKADMGKFMVKLPEADADEFPLDPQVLRKVTDEAELEDYLLPPRSVVVNDTTVKSFEDVVGHEKDLVEGTILNAGGFVTSISWAPGFDGFEQYLAVGVLDDNHRDPMDCKVNTLETSLFSRKGYPSSIYIYKVNLDPSVAGTSICELVSSFSHDYGSAVDLRWRTQETKNDSDGAHIGLLAMVNQDGFLRVLSIPKDDTLTRYKIESPLRSFETPGYKITCFCWRTETVLAVGTDMGSVAEFDISDTSDYGLEPSFMVSVSSSNISTISSAYPNEQHVLFVYSTDGTSCLVDVRTLRSRQYAMRNKSFSAVSTYLPWASCFACTDDILSVRLQPLRDFRSQGPLNSVTTHTAVVTAVGVSHFHPFILSGGMDGAVKIGNSVRKLLVPKRPLASTYLYATLWGFDYSMKHKAYRFANLHKTEKIGKGEAIELLQPHPPNAFVTGIEWSRNVNTAEWYAASTSSGLIKIHRLIDADTTV